MLGLLGMRNSAMMTEFYKILPLFFLTLALPVLADKIEETTDSEVYCITHAKRLILENDQTVNNGITFNNCLKASSGSNPTVWFFTGYMKLHAIGSKPDYDEGVFWLSKAAENGMAVAQKELADHYLTGLKANQKTDIPKAIKWLKMLANNSNLQLKDEATFKLCALNLYGTGGIEVNYEEALLWCRKSGLENHNTDGLANLAYMYINGLGIKKNVSMAIDYYKNAANKGSIPAQISLGRVYSTGKDLTPDYEEALYWFSKASSQHNALAQFYLAQMYEYGTGVEKNPQKAFELYEESANSGEPQSQYMLGRWYQYSTDPKLDLAAKWYHKAAKQNNTDAMMAIAEMYRYQNAKEMILWYQRAAEKGNPQARLKLIEIYLHGTRETSPKPEMAFQQAEILDNQGVEDGTYWLGYMYHRGMGTESDTTKAKSILQPIAESENIPAKLELSLIKYEEGAKNEALNDIKTIAELRCAYDSCSILADLYEQSMKLEKAFYWITIASSFEDSASGKKQPLKEKLSKEQVARIEKEAYKFIENLQ